MDDLLGKMVLSAEVQKLAEYERGRRLLVCGERTVTA